MVRFSAVAVSHRGRVRDGNEDSVVVTDRLVAVADGLGGHAAGEVASRIAVDRLARLGVARDVDVDIDIDIDDVLAAVADANRLIVDAATRPGCHGMGTTLCGVCVVVAGGQEHWAVFNVGDSRVYGYRDGVLAQISVDHSEVQQLRDAGRITAQEAARHPRRNVITRSLGSVPAPAADLWVLAASDVERFLVCSDGLTGELDDARIAAILGAHRDAGTAATALLEQALAAGGHDNITVAVVDVPGSIR